MRLQGVDPSRSASIIALLSLPHAIYFLWGPITDFFVRRRTWLILAAVAAAATFIVAFLQPNLGSSRAVEFMFLGACFGVVVRCMRRHDGRSQERGQSPPRRQLLSDWLACRGSHRSLCARRVLLAPQLPTLGLIFAAMIVVPSLLAFAAPPQQMIREHNFRQTARSFL